MPNSENIISQHLQDSFLYLSIMDKEFLKLVRSSVDHSLFVPATSYLVKVCFEYYDVFKDAPKDHIHDEILKRLKTLSTEDKKYYTTYIKKIKKLSPPNFDYVLKSISDFIKARTLEEASITFKDLVTRGNFSEAENLMYTALKAGVEREEVGLIYFEDSEFLHRNKEEDELLMRTGIGSLDYLIRGYRRGQFLVFLGNYGGGKSWALTHLGRSALMRGLKVLHISHENSIRETVDRYDMMFGALVNTPEPQEVEVAYWDKEEEAITKYTKTFQSIYNTKLVAKTRKKMKAFGGELVVKKYAMGSCDMKEISRYINYLETYEDWVPDVLINDYADIMMPLDQKKESRNQINDTYIYHKRIADEKNILVVTASQTTRQAIGKAKISMKDFAEDIRKAGNVDLGIAICRTEDQVEQNEGYLYVLKNRNGKQNCGCYIGFNPMIGQFATWNRLTL